MNEAKSGLEALGGGPEIRAVENREMFDNPLDGLRNGALLDFRVSVAVDLLKHSRVFEGVGAQLDIDAARLAASLALDLATELVELAWSRGLIRPLDSPEAMERLGAHVKRQTEFAWGQAQEQRRVQDQAVAIGGAVRNVFAP